MMQGKWAYCPICKRTTYHRPDGKCSYEPIHKPEVKTTLPIGEVALIEKEKGA